MAAVTDPAAGAYAVEALTADLADAFAGRGGGLVGWALSEPLFDFLGPFLAALVYLALLFWALMLLAERSGEDLRRGLERASAALAAWADRVDPDRIDVVGHADVGRSAAPATPPPAPEAARSPATTNRPAFGPPVRQAQRSGERCRRPSARMAPGTKPALTPARRRRCAMPPQPATATGSR